MQYLWDILSFYLICMLFFCTCDWLTNRITKGGKFGRVIECVTHSTVFVLSFNLICVIAILLGVETNFMPKTLGLVAPLVMATVSALVLFFLMQKLAQKRRSIEGTELHSK